MIDILKPMIQKFMPFAQKQMGFDRPPKLFLKNNTNEANNPMGKTGYYDPQNESITIYIGKRHPKDIMRSLSHELMHHTQKCNGEFDNVENMGEQGYAQANPHMRTMEIQAYKAAIVFRDWEDSCKGTIYYEHLQKGENKMSTKDWKNKEITQLLSEAWGFKFNNLEEFNSFNEGADKNDGLEPDGEDTSYGHMKEEEESVDEAQTPDDKEDEHLGAKDGKESGKKQSMKDRRKEMRGARRADGEDGDPDSVDEGADGDDETISEQDEVFAPNHYCVHHGGVSRNGSVEMAEAVSHNFNEDLGKVTHYDMKFEDGSIMEGVPFEDIHVTNASLAEGHDHPVGKRDPEEELEESTDDADALREAIRAVLLRHLKG
jgi:hypothetical protein